jgi:hypothetical protein
MSRWFEERFSTYQAMILNIHVSLHHISIQWILEECVFSSYVLYKKKLQLNKQKLHHCIKHIPSTNENNKDNIDNITLGCSIIYNLVKTSKVLIGCSKERLKWCNYKCKYSNCNHFFVCT